MPQETMKHQLPQTEFGTNAENPFDGDLLNRRQNIKDLTPVIENIPSPTVMALNAPWGAGKTAFVQMWARHLTNKQIPALYFNAWKTDYAPDPLVPFAETIAEELSVKGRKKLMASVKALAPTFTGILARNVAGDDAAKIAEKFVDGWLGHQSEIDKLQNMLENYAEAQEKKRVVVFVDELDRCRPDYAVKVLERIKHLFEVQGLIFILAINREQLCHSVRALYGADINADIYLRRFIDFDFTIKQPHMDAFIKSRLDNLGVHNFLESRKNYPALRDDYNRLCQTLTLLARLYKCSLRDAEQLLTRVVFVLNALEDTKENKHYFYPVLLAFLVMMRLTEPTLYNKYILPGDSGLKMLAHWENQLKEFNYEDRPYGQPEPFTAALITAQIIMAKGSIWKNYDFLEKMINSYKEKERIATTKEEGHYYRALIHTLENSRHSDDINLPRLVKKIEMLDEFCFPTNDTPENKNN